MVGLLMPYIRSFAIKHGILDIPNSYHKTHSIPVPYLGGIAIIFTITFLSILGTLIYVPIQLYPLLGLLAPCIILGLVGLIDDIFDVKPILRLVAQTIVGVFSAFFLIKTKTLGSPSGSLIIDMTLTIIFFVFLSNSINFFDNIDGGASGAVAIASGFLCILAIQGNQFFIAALSALFCGSNIGFLWWNRQPARIYLGDSGSLFLGSLLAAMLVRFETNANSLILSAFVIIFLIAVPLLDTCIALSTRIWQRKSPLRGGQDHLSHRILSLGTSKRTTVFILWFLILVFGILSFVLSNIENKYKDVPVILGCLIWVSLFIYFFQFSIDREVKEMK